MNGLFALPALFALIACNGSFDERVHQEFHQTIGANGVSLVQVDNVAGSVRIEGWAKPTAEVRATKYGSDAQQLRATTISVRRAGTAISITTKYAEGMHGGGVRYRISVPANAALRIDNVAGTVDVAGVRGNVAVRTQAGEIVADLGLVGGRRSIDLQATTGAIRVWLAATSSARIEAHSTVGALSSDISGISQTRENLVGMRAGGRIGSGSAQIRLETTTGAITLRQHS